MIRMLGNDTVEEVLELTQSDDSPFEVTIRSGKFDAY